MATVNMKETEYYKSGQQVKNLLAVRELALVSLQQKKEERILLYNECPRGCTECNTPLIYSKRRNKFCTKSCAASFNNRRRNESGWVLSEESKKKISWSVRNVTASLTPEERISRNVNRSINSAERPKKHPDVELTCPHCGISKFVSYSMRGRKTCGADDCKIYASVGIRKYPNGRRKTTWFFNPTENKQVLLESSWEVIIAELMIELNIKWLRPKFIKWVDVTGTTRRYFPDFYLPKYNMYLDPKNPWGIANSIDKMQKVSSQIPIIYGDIEMIKDYIRSLQ